MRRGGVVFWCILLIVCAVSNGDEPKSQCVRVLVKDKKIEGNDSRSGGTGAFIGPQLIVTAEHVIKDRINDRVEILFPDWQLVEGEVILTDADLDVAVVEMDHNPRGINPLALGKLSPGVRLSVQGYGYGPYRQDWGVLSGVKLGKWRKVTGASARSGDSGGPVLDAEGRYCGTLWGSVDGETYFTPVEVVTKLILDWGLPTPAPSPYKPY